MNPPQLVIRLPYTPAPLRSNRITSEYLIPLMLTIRTFPSLYTLIVRSQLIIRLHRRQGWSTSFYSDTVEWVRFVRSIRVNDEKRNRDERERKKEIEHNGEIMNFGRWETILNCLFFFFTKEYMCWFDLIWHRVVSVHCGH